VTLCSAPSAFTFSSGSQLEQVYSPSASKVHVRFPAHLHLKSRLVFQVPSNAATSRAQPPASAAVLKLRSS